jgi:hypothetical protein
MSVRALMLLALISIVGWATTYKEADPAGPHAMLRFAAQEGIGGALGGQSLQALDLNGLPTSQWKLSGRQYVAPGQIN